MYNCCRRVPVLFPNTLYALHFQTFMQDEEFNDECKDMLRKLVSNDDNDVIPESLDMIALKHGMHCEDKMSGAHGKTAKLWMFYCHLVDICLVFQWKGVMLIVSLMCCMICQRCFSQQITKTVWSEWQDAL